MRGASITYACALTACSLLTDLDGLRGGSGDGGGDAGSDASGSSCGGQHIICDDFNSSASLSGSVSNSATMEIATDTFISPPSSLRVTPTFKSAYGYVLRTFQTPLPTDFTCSVFMRVENYPDAYYSFLSPVLLYDVDDSNLVDYEVTYLGNNPNGFLDEHVELGDASPTDDGKQLPYPIGDGAWHRVTLKVHLGASPSAELDLDDAGIGAMKSITPPSKITAIAFAVGLKSGGTEPQGSPSWVAHFDDAVCDAL